MTGWQPTHALLRAALGAVTVALAAVLFGRPDLLVLVAGPALHAAVAVVRRPASAPRWRSAPRHTSLREGQASVVHASVEDVEGADHAVVAVAPQAWTRTSPASGVVAVPVSGAGAEIDVAVRSTRWGRRPVGQGRAAVWSSWGGYRHGPVPLASSTLTTLPVPGPFDATAPVPHPLGVVGVHPARRTGSGSEFAGIRPFAVGDRLRRVHWPVSLRTGALHVTTTVADEDAAVLLVVDASVDLGVSGAVDDDAASSLDVGVRAAAAVAEHFLREGDRVGLRVLGSTRHQAVPARAGRAHLRRLLDTLARVTPGKGGPVPHRVAVPAGAVVVVLSPMLSELAVSTTSALARRGVDVVVVDTLPGEVAFADDTRRLAWRLRRLEREATLSRLEHIGVPVVAWRGPGTLDQVLRRLTRRAGAPRVVRR